MTTFRQNARESAKLALRRALYKFDLDISRQPFTQQVGKTLRANHIDTVVDVGANIGQYASMLRSFGFEGQIISVEPLDDAFAVLKRRCAKDARWSAVNAAAGAEPGTLTIHKASNSYSSSLLPITSRHTDAAPKSVTVGEQEVSVLTVSDLVATYSIDPSRTLLKVDTQGYEMPVLKGAGALLDEFAALQLEMSFVELYDGQVLFDELREDIQGRGFRIWAVESGFSDQDGRMLQCDALFLGARAGV